MVDPKNMVFEMLGHNGIERRQRLTIKSLQCISPAYDSNDCEGSSDSTRGIIEAATQPCDSFSACTEGCYLSKPYSIKLTTATEHKQC